ncbi:MAG TPA: branched-chain amino acid ABC transporter permease [Acidimicrobiia bacterium]|jgi:branched-chain amino acid transport system permease protein|nr:branched-chain amino acid ABC transporter permease [Acidimicrobiia bacterium]
MTERLLEGSGTSLVGGTEAHVSRSLWSLTGPVLVVIAAGCLAPIWLGDSRVLMNVAVLGVSFGCYAIGFNLIFGSTGQLFLCVGALAGLGGYTAAILADTVGLPIVVSVVVAMVGSSLVGGLLSWVAVRRSLGVIFTGIITLIFTLVYDNLLLGLGDLTGGENGFLISSGKDSFIRQQIPPYYVLLALLGIFLMVHGLLRRSHIGWAFRALRDDEVAAELAGVNVARYRVYAALIGAAMLGLTGALYAFTKGRISPSTFGFAQVDVVVLVMLAFGGIGTLFGPVLGSVVFTIIDELLIALGQLRVLVYGALIIALFLWLPRGVIPTFGGRFRWRRR